MTTPSNKSEREAALEEAAKIERIVENRMAECTAKSRNESAKGNTEEEYKLNTAWHWLDAVLRDIRALASSPPKPAVEVERALHFPKDGRFCTFGVPDERKPRWLLRFEDADVGDMYFDNESDALSKYDGCNDNWNCTLFVTARYPIAKPAVAEDVVERAKAVVMEAYADFWGLSGDELPDNCAVAITDALTRANLLRTPSSDGGEK